MAQPPLPQPMDYRAPQGARNPTAILGKTDLARAAIQVIEAGDGQQALDACRESMPDCVLLDWNMPVMDGITFLRCLREEFGPDEPPVLFCTTENDMTHIARAIGWRQH